MTEWVVGLGQRERRGNYQIRVINKVPMTSLLSISPAHFSRPVGYELSCCCCCSMPQCVWFAVQVYMTTGLQLCPQEKVNSTREVWWRTCYFSYLRFKDIDCGYQKRITINCCFVCIFTWYSYNCVLLLRVGRNTWNKLKLRIDKKSKAASRWKFSKRTHHRITDNRIVYFTCFYSFSAVFYNK